MDIGPRIQDIKEIGGSTVGAGNTLTKEPYATVNTNWFMSKPYGFTFFDKDSKPNQPATSTIYLPISPNNLTINTHFATNIVTTLYGIVEEHSEIRYYDIVIQGTTGIAPRYIGENKNNKAIQKSKSVGRKEFKPDFNLDLGGFLPEVTNTISQVADIYTDIKNTVNGGNNNPTGLSPDKSGYAAFHQLYKFLHKYKQDASGENTKSKSAVSLSIDSLGNAFGGSSNLLPAKSAKPRYVHPLQFLNYKDGNKYDCIPISFTMVRSAENPMLYQYNIRLRGFNLRSVDDKNMLGEDMLAKLGFGDIKGQSLFSDLTSVAGNATTLISAIL